MNNAQSFGGALSQWLMEHSLGRKPGTQKFNREIIDIIHRRWPGFLNAPASRITTETITTFAQSVTHYCPSRWNGIVSALQFATPAASMLKRRPLRSKDRAILSQLEFSKLVEELDTRPRSHSGLMVRFLAQTGLRIAEARQLEWTHVDIDDGCFRVPGAVTKNAKPRMIPFVRGVRETLTRLKAVAGESDLVLPQRECKGALRGACKRLKLPKLLHHDFRHLFATRCIQSGVDLPTVARWLGHRDGGALLARTYFHLVDSHSRAMAAKVVV